MDNLADGGERAAKLARMRELLAVLGHPERSFRACQVVGSKGKGSTARMLAEILAAEYGRPVGVYASPHLRDERERISSTAGFFDEAVYRRARERVERAEKEFLGDLTWFQRMTAWGFCCFQEAGCEWVVVEAGIGGRWDMTNVFERPEVSVITALELTHCERLGWTIEEIAREKGGIMRAGVPVVVGAQKYAEAYEALREVAEGVGTEMIVAGALPRDCVVRMRGRVQRENAAVAREAGRLLGCSEVAVREGLARAWLPGRFEVRDFGRATVVLDAAHTVMSWRALMETFAEYCAEVDPAGERPRYLLARFKCEARDLVVGAFDSVWEATGLADFEPMAQAALAQAEADGAIILAAGSFYLLDAVENVL